MSTNNKTTNIGQIVAKNVRDISSRVKYSPEKDLNKQSAARFGGASLPDWRGSGGDLNQSMADDFLGHLLKMGNNADPNNIEADLQEAEQNKNEKIDGTNSNFFALKEQEEKKKLEIREVDEGKSGESVFSFMHPTAGEVEVTVKKQADRFLVCVDMQKTLSLKERYLLGQMMSRILSANLGKNLEVIIG